MAPAALFYVLLRVYDTIEHFRTVFIVMEHLEGRSLMELLARQGRLAPQAAIGFLRQACAAIAYADREGLIHRDIHPGNMIVAAALAAGGEDNITALVASMESSRFGTLK